MIADKSSGLALLDVLRATDVQVFFSKWFGGQPDGKSDSSFGFLLVHRPVAGTIKGRFKL